MDRLTRIAARSLRWSVHLLPPARQPWGEAIEAESGQVAAGSARLSWLVGGLWMVAREAGMVRRIGYTLAAGTAGAAMVALDWHPGSTNPGAPLNRASMIATVLVLAILPWLAGRFLGPVADNRAARVVRAGGYLSVYALLLVMVALSRFAGSRFDHFQAFDQATWEADMRSGAVVGGILVIAIVGGYAAAILAVTARRTAVPPSALGTGAALGVGIALALYALMPLGNVRHPGSAWLAAGNGLALFVVPAGGLLAAGVRAARLADAPSSDPVSPPEPADERRIGVGAIAGVCAGAAAALLITILTVTTMLFLPRQVHLKWANPDPNVPHGTTYEVQMSVGDAAIKYQAGLLLGPLVGLIVGAIAGASMTGAATPRPVSTKVMSG
jgi:hypothetical protein